MIHNLNVENAREICRKHGYGAAAARIVESIRPPAGDAEKSDLIKKQLDEFSKALISCVESCYQQIEKRKALPSRSEISNSLHRVKRDIERLMNTFETEWPIIGPLLDIPVVEWLDEVLSEKGAESVISTNIPERGFGGSVSKDEYSRRQLRRGGMLNAGPHTIGKLLGQFRDLISAEDERITPGAPAKHPFEILLTAALAEHYERFAEFLATATHGGKFSSFAQDVFLELQITPSYEWTYLLESGIELNRTSFGSRKIHASLVESLKSDKISKKVSRPRKRKFIAPNMKKTVF